MPPTTSLRLAALVVWLSSLVFAPAAARATVSFEFSTSDSQFDPGVDNQGWWSSTFLNADDNDNYVLGTGPNDSSDSIHRNFFTFDLSALPASAQVVSATLRLTRFDSIGTEAVETIEFFDVLTDAATLNRNDGPLNPAIFADLGSGASYGAFDIPGTGAGADVLEFVLGPATLADIASAAGGFFSIGGSLITNDHDILFGNSQDGGTRALVVVAIPEPATGAMLAIGLLGFARRSRPAR